MLKQRCNHARLTWLRRLKRVSSRKGTHASRLVRSSQNFSQKVDLFLMRSTLVLSVRGSVLPLLLADTPVHMLCSEAELFAMNEEPAAAPSLSDWEPERCIFTPQWLTLRNITTNSLLRTPPPQHKYQQITLSSTIYHILLVLHFRCLRCRN